MTFDYCWPSGPFGSYIKSTLRQDPGILYAVLAVSARYLEAVRSEEWDSNEYERKCLGILIPMLNDRNVAEPQGDGVLVSALLLRLLDEMTDLWDHLLGYLDSWDQAKPSSFEPLNELHSIGLKDRASTFPDIYYIHDCAVSGRQYLEICKIILLAHDPRTPSLGLGRASYVKAQEEKIRESVRIICGIWMSNEEHVPARVLVGLAIGIAGELFTDPDETRQLYNIVLEAERHVGWPCLKVSPSLQAFWGLDDAVIAR
ncbi:hypothetical protein K4K59_006033 [Colletotrichum sp. SAR11_240]|nr:hypothetical protein K4K59_006033 [Colletotrichum sp. SAR11_240]